MDVLKMPFVREAGRGQNHNLGLLRNNTRDEQQHSQFSEHRPGSDIEEALSQPDADEASHSMEGVDAYRRRRIQMLGQDGTRTGGKRKGRRKSQGQQDVSKEGLGDHHRSDASSVCASDNVELDHLASDCLQSDDDESGLDQDTKRRRKQRQNRDMDLDARIEGSLQVSKLGQKMADRKVLKSLLLNSLLVASWYLFSLSISIYNTWMFSPKHLDFHFPLFTTCMHMVVQFCLASLVLCLVPSLRPRTDSISNPHNCADIRRDDTPSNKSLMTRTFYLTRIGPCGAATGLDIGLGNMSLKFITLTFYTMCKSSSLAFVLTFAFLFRLENPSIKLVSIIVTMTIGVIMMVAGEVSFDALGFILVILAAFFSGFRWSLTQILLLRSPATSNPFSSIFFLAPIMFLSLAVIAIPVEGFADLGRGLQKLVEAKGGFLGGCILLFPGLLAFLMTASEFALLQRTSVVTLSICGIFKEVVTISAAGIVFHDPLTPINVSGLLVTIASIAAYNYFKISKMRKDARLEVEGYPELLGDDGDPDGEAAKPMLASHDETNGRLTPPTLREDQRKYPVHVTTGKFPQNVDDCRMFN